MEFEFILSLRENQMDVSYLMILGVSFVAIVFVFALIFQRENQFWKVGVNYGGGLCKKLTKVDRQWRGGQFGQKTG